VQEFEKQMAKISIKVKPKKNMKNECINNLIYSFDQKIPDF